MDQNLVGKWVEVTLVNEKTWIGILQEWDEEALFISNGEKFGTEDFKGSECASEEVKHVVVTEKRAFEIA
ncbi:MAG: hypothetical protein CME65_09020 [Halobacteriovoraceae bacterium]|nr:hypothetical protein [Halobacteriovoraceae bacterium]|tara:strand:+ start:8175 stop:8384 length:210 start_codon:yes stop_codon:yes gene_type:complete